MKGSSGKLGRKKERAITALLENQTLADAARAVGIGETTLWRWLQEPGFKSAFREAKRRVLDEALTTLQKATGKAIGALVSILEDQGKPASARVTAAKTILETAVKSIQVEALEARVEQLERAISRV
jgi:DNA-binding MurR/RpiR family transcriptional regulator